MTTGHYCYVCRAGYRSGSGTHLSTAHHRNAVHAAETRIHGRGKDHDATLGYRRPHIGRALAGDSGEGKVKVKRWSTLTIRRGPSSGSRRRYYWRDAPASFTDSQGRRRTFRRADYA